MQRRLAWRTRRGAFIGAALCCCLGCGSPSDQLAVHPVQGKVLWEGKPVPGAMVVLHPETEHAGQAVRPVAYTKEDGSFSIATYDVADGAPAGRYLATVEWYVRPTGTEDQEIVVPNRLPPRYGSPRTSRLEVEVLAGSNDLQPFQLTR